MTRFRSSITVDEAVEILRALGCSEDPIWIRGVETSPHGIDAARGVGNRYGGADVDGHRLASRVRIQFYGTRPQQDGTLADMVYNRMNLRVARARTKGGT